MPTLCIQLGSFATLILNFVPAVEKALSLWIQSLMHLVVIQCFTSNNDVANIRSKLLSCDLRFCVIRLQSTSSCPFCGEFHSRSNLFSKVSGAMWEVQQSELLRENTIEEPSSSRCSMGSLFKLSLQFVFGQQRETIQYLPLLFYILFPTTDRLGLESMLL